MSTLSVDTLTDKSAAESVDMTAVVHGPAKAWGNWDIAASLDDSHNLSSVTDIGTGEWAPQYTNNFDSAGYAAFQSNHHSTTTAILSLLESIAAGSITVAMVNTSATHAESNVTAVGFAGHGDLA